MLKRLAYPANKRLTHQTSLLLVLRLQVVVKKLEGKKERDTTSPKRKRVEESNAKWYGVLLLAFCVFNVYIVSSVPCPTPLNLII